MLRRWRDTEKGRRLSLSWRIFITRSPTRGVLRLRRCQTRHGIGMRSQEALFGSFVERIVKCHKEMRCGGIGDQKELTKIPEVVGFMGLDNESS